MPYVRIETNRSASAEAVLALRQCLVRALHQHKGAPVELVSTVVHQAVAMGFGEGDDAPAAVVVLHSTPCTNVQIHSLIEAFTAALRSTYDVRPDRTYVFFTGLTDPTQVAWNATPMDQIVAARDAARKTNGV